jgi:hypothetical protein
MMWLVKVSLLSSQKNDTPGSKAHQEHQVAEFARIYCVCCSATKDVGCTYILEMNVVDFQSWVQRRDRQRREHVPVADKILPLIVQAGQAGMTRGEIGKAIGDSLDHDAVDDLLAGLVEFGLLAVTRQNNLVVFQAAGNFPSRSPSLKPNSTALHAKIGKAGS